MSDAAIAYKHYRIYITTTPRNDYATINQLRLFESVSKTATNIATTLSGATATSSGNYNAGVGPENILTETGYWESSNTTSPKWVVVSYETAKSVRAFELIATQYENETPKDFKFQGSNDQTTWIDIEAVIGNVSSAYLSAPYLDLSGTSKLESGDKSSRVLVYDWLTGALLKSIVPSFNGIWSCPLRYDDDVFVTHLGTSGYEPKTDGPIKPYSRQ
jgi:hypothetical protein